MTRRYGGRTSSEWWVAIGALGRFLGAAFPARVPLKPAKRIGVCELWLEYPKPLSMALKIARFLSRTVPKHGPRENIQFWPLPEWFRGTRGGREYKGHEPQTVALAAGDDFASNLSHGMMVVIMVVVTMMLFLVGTMFPIPSPRFSPSIACSFRLKGSLVDTSGKFLEV